MKKEEVKTIEAWGIIFKDCWSKTQVGYPIFHTRKEAKKYKTDIENYEIKKIKIEIL